MNYLRCQYSLNKRLNLRRSFASLTNGGNEFHILVAIKEKKDLSRHSKLHPGNSKIVPDPLRLQLHTLRLNKNLEYSLELDYVYTFLHKDLLNFCVLRV